MAETQWQCPTCKTWVSMAYSKHIHYVAPDEGTATLDDMIRARDAGIDATQPTIHETPWSPDYPRRKAPDQCQP